MFCLWQIFALLRLTVAKTVDGEGSVHKNVRTEDVALTQAFRALFGAFLETLKQEPATSTQGHEERSTRTASSSEQ